MYNTNMEIREIIEIIAGVISVLLGGGATHTAIKHKKANLTLAERVVKLETQQTTTFHQLNRVEKKIDTIIEMERRK